MSKYIKPPASHECKWRSGPPPSVGWWPASAGFDPTNLRHWNGKFWSLSVKSWCSADDVSVASGERFYFLREAPEIRWTDRWWEGKQ